MNHHVALIRYLHLSIFFTLINNGVVIIEMSSPAHNGWKLERKAKHGVSEKLHNGKRNQPQCTALDFNSYMIIHLSVYVKSNKAPRKEGLTLSTPSYHLEMVTLITHLLALLWLALPCLLQSIHQIHASSLSSLKHPQRTERVIRCLSLSSLSLHDW